MVACDITELLATLKRLVAAARKREKPESLLQRSRAWTRRLFQNLHFQILTALLMASNFFTNAFEAQMNGKLLAPDGSPSGVTARGFGFIPSAKHPER